jgi:hypothetical protein
MLTHSFINFVLILIHLVIKDVDKTTFGNKNSDPNARGLDIKRNSCEFDSNLNDEDYDYIEIKNSDTVVSFKEAKLLNNNINSSSNNTDKNITINNNTISGQMMPPHEKNAINFLINEYLLEQNYKMTSVTFSEENESQDLEDWDVIGLNRSKPPNLWQIYKNYLNKKYEQSNNKSSAMVTTNLVNKKNSLTEVSVQTECTELNTTFTNTEIISLKCFESQVNFDHDSFENQRLQISKLIEKQEILVKSISNLEQEINRLNLDRETNLKKIDLLYV